MNKITKADYEGILFGSNIVEESTKTGRTFHKTTLTVNGVKKVIRMITTAGTVYLTLKPKNTPNIGI